MGFIEYLNEFFPPDTFKAIGILAAVVIGILIFCGIVNLIRKMIEAKRRLLRKMSEGMSNTVHTAIRSSQQASVEKSRIKAEKELEAQRIEKLKIQAEAERTNAQARLEKEQREALSAIKSHCPSCGAPNKTKSNECSYCHSLLV